MKNLVVFPMLILALNICAQNNEPGKYASAITVAGLKKHLTIIAGEEMQGRETGTTGQRKAAAYIEEQFRAIGLKKASGMKGYQQYYPLYKDSMLSSEFKLANQEAVYGIDYIIPVNANANSEYKSNAIVFAGYGIEDSAYNDYASIDVKNKIVAIFLGEPKVNNIYLTTGTNRSSEWTYPGISKKVELASKKGAIGVMLINPLQETFNERSVMSSKKSNLFYPPKMSSATLNYIIISHEFAKKIFGEPMDSFIGHAKSSIPFLKNELVEKSIDAELKYAKNREVIEASNVIGIIEGTDKKDEYVFLTGHYDHLGIREGKIYYGADDDGSGTVAVIAMAQAFIKAKASGHGPRRTIVFMTVSGEEKGLWGSEYYSDHPVYPLEETSADLNTDMVGRIDTERKKADTMNYVYVVGHDKLSSDLPVINEGINNKFTHLTLDYKFDDPADKERIYFRSDHYNFARKGVPVLFFYDGMLKADYHKPSDTIEKITWPLYETRVRMIFHTAWEIANRNDMLKRDIPLPESAMGGR